MEIFYLYCAFSYLIIGVYWGKEFFKPQQTVREAFLISTSLIIAPLSLLALIVCKIGVTLRSR